MPLLPVTQAVILIANEDEVHHLFQLFYCTIFKARDLTSYGAKTEDERRDVMTVLRQNNLPRVGQRLV